jgi:hypothetical protein
MSISLQSLPDSEIVTYKFVFQQALVAPLDFTSNTTTQDSLLVGIPDNWVICGVKILPIIQFVGASVSSLTCQIGSTTVTNAYAPAFELTTAVSPTVFQISSPLAAAQTTAHDLNARFISTGASINAISAGMVEITVQIRKI